jgi:hypothetical protein
MSIPLPTVQLQAFVGKAGALTGVVRTIPPMSYSASMSLGAAEKLAARLAAAQGVSVTRIGRGSRRRS